MCRSHTGWRTVKELPLSGFNGSDRSFGGRLWLKDPLRPYLKHPDCLEGEANPCAPSTGVLFMSMAAESYPGAGRSSGQRTGASHRRGPSQARLQQHVEPGDPDVRRPGQRPGSACNWRCLVLPGASPVRDRGRVHPRSGTPHGNECPVTSQAVADGWHPVRRGGPSCRMGYGVLGTRWADMCDCTPPSSPLRTPEYRGVM